MQRRRSRVSPSLPIPSATGWVRPTSLGIIVLLGPPEDRLRDNAERDPHEKYEAHEHDGFDQISHFGRPQAALPAPGPHVRNYPPVLAVRSPRPVGSQPPGNWEHAPVAQAACCVAPECGGP